MVKLNKKIIIIILFLLVIVISNTTVFARTPNYSNNAKFTRGVGNTCYWIASSASRYTTGINNAANRWVNTGVGSNPIYMTLVSSNKGTHIDIYGKTPSNDTVLTNDIFGYASFWSSSSQLVSPKGIQPDTNYFYSEVVLNTGLTISTVTIAHEMGHCFGLADYWGATVDTIMWPYEDDGNRAETVQQSDNDTINYLY